MQKPRLVPATAVALVLSAGSLLAQPLLTLASPAGMTPSASTPAVPSHNDFVELSAPAVNTYDAPLQGLELASNEPEMSPLLAPMLALYSQLLALDSNGSGGIALQRLQARLGADVAEKTGLLDINDVLTADLDKVELVAIGGAQLKSLGVAAGQVDKLPLLGPLTDDVKAAMMELPQGLAAIEGPVALAIWGQDGLASLVIRAN